MKLQPDPHGNDNIVTAYASDFIAVGGRVLTRSLLLLPDRLDEQWGPDAYAGLSIEHVVHLAAFSCDVVLLGTGRRQRFPAPELLRPLVEAGRGFEIMDTAAACRTYNILVGEGRLPLAALILEKDPA
ncbi:Mth938-like domain-containing protein [Sulfuricystis thermophila]|uniref:Mth938-like domain-containing protein n=1 Tax=Sulfuricystis thermophila TaxID=2496847 RepID=UPI001036B15D|nr:Mth938-like domain-containing protein [Sulfuricystis thermophila]